MKKILLIFERKIMYYKNHTIPLSSPHPKSKPMYEGRRALIPIRKKTSMVIDHYVGPLSDHHFS